MVPQISPDPSQDTYRPSDDINQSSEASTSSTPLPNTQETDHTMEKVISQEGHVGGLQTDQSDAKQRLKMLTDNAKSATGRFAN